MINYQMISKFEFLKFKHYLEIEDLTFSIKPLLMVPHLLHVFIHASVGVKISA